jgi:hypothetical protein
MASNGAYPRKMPCKKYQTLYSFSDLFLCLAGQRITWRPILRSETAIITDGFKQSWYQEAGRFTYSPQRFINGISFPLSHHYRKLRLSLRYAERLLRITAEPFPMNRFSSIEDLCFAAVRAFPRVSLSSVERGIGPGAVNRPLEAQYQGRILSGLPL